MTSDILAALPVLEGKKYLQKLKCRHWSGKALATSLAKECKFLQEYEDGTKLRGS